MQAPTSTASPQPGAPRTPTEASPEDLRRMVREFHALVDSITDGVFAVDASARITVANPAFARRLGVRPEEFVGRLLSDVIGESNSARYPDGRALRYDELPVVRALRGEVLRDFEKLTLNRSTGRDVRVRVNASPIRDDDGEIIGAVEILRDVTELMELETAKDEFIRVAAHELQTPVTIIKGYAQEILRTMRDLPEEKKRMIDAISRATDRLARLFRDVVDMSQLQLKRGSLAVERVAMNDIVERIAESAARGSGTHRVRVTRLEPAVVRGDPERLEQVLRTLVDNAIRYSPEGGDVEIECVISGDDAIATVTDHGVGIPSDRQGRIFERFYRAHTDTSHDFGGIGVGLCVARLLVREMGGDMWFESEVEHGSRFHVSVATWRADATAR